MILPARPLFLGGGQLGRMFTARARTMGYEVVVLDPDPLSPAGGIATRHLAAAYDDPSALEQLAGCAQAVTTEFENVPATALAFLAARVRVRPQPDTVADAAHGVERPVHRGSVQAHASAAEAVGAAGAILASVDGSAVRRPGARRVSPDLAGRRRVRARACDPHDARGIGTRGDLLAGMTSRLACTRRRIRAPELGRGRVATIMSCRCLMTPDRRRATLVSHPSWSV